ncbi:MAG: DUF1080 domain-containing protein [Saprospiraceae bacterium]|nr:DUF1080 domain-containing protein [Saprospiraceae bacterium]
MIKNLFFFGLLCNFIFLSCSSPKPSPEIVDGWHILFNGQDLTGWNRLNGNAEFTVEDGVIIGTTKPSTPNTFLATNDKYGDFALEFEVKIDTFINSGVQFRSNTTDYMNGKVHGYQAEIDPSSRAWSGGIYDESRRGWLFPMGLNPDGGRAFKPLEWNKIYVEAIGSEIKTWVNDEPAAFLIDDMTLNGFIALQIHSVDRPELHGRKIRWRNIRLKENPEKRSGSFPFIVNTEVNKLSDAEKSLGWISLFDGHSTDNWRSIHQENFPVNSWKIDNGDLALEPGDKSQESVGDIITRDQFGAFDFQLEFNLTKGGNSGIKYFVDESYNDAQSKSGIGLEYQIIDDKDHPAAKEGGLPPSHTLGSLYDLIPAEKPERFVRPPGEWNHVRIVVKPNNIVEHWLNHIKVLEFKRGSQEYINLVKNSKYKDFKNFGLAKQGHLLLQNHGDAVKFRSIKIRPLQ